MTSASPPIEYERFSTNTSLPAGRPVWCESVPVVGGPPSRRRVFAPRSLRKSERFGLMPLRLLDSRHGGVEVLLIEIADCRRGHVGVLHELIEARCPLAAQTDEADLDLVAGRRPCVRSGSAGDDSSGERLYESSSTGHLQSDYRQAVRHAAAGFRPQKWRRRKGRNPAELGADWSGADISSRCPPVEKNTPQQGTRPTGVSPGGDRVLGRPTRVTTSRAD